MASSPKWILLVVWSVVLLTDNLTKCDLLHMAPSEELKEYGFHIAAKSREIVTKVGSSIELSCQTNKPWYLCGWQISDGIWCDRLSTTKYDSSCQADQRIRYDKVFLDPLKHPDPKLDCSITVVDVNVGDNHAWVCLVMDDVRSSVKPLETVNVIVASPYLLELQPQRPLVVKGMDNETDSDVICIAKGQGGVDPEVIMQINRKTTSDVEYWKEIQTDGSKLFYASLSINETMENGSRISCISKQKSPNGTILFESHAAVMVTVTEPMRLNKEKEENGTSVPKGIAGGTITGIIVLVTILAIALICYAQKTKKWCYSKSYQSESRASEVTDIHSNPEHGGHNEDGLGGNEETEEHQVRTSNNTTQLVDGYGYNNESMANNDTQILNRLQSVPVPNVEPPNTGGRSPIRQPPSAPPLERHHHFANSGGQFFSFPEDLTLRQREIDERHRELIHSSLSGLEIEPEEPTVRFMPTFSSPTRQLSETLTQPREQNLRRTNEYVRVKPTQPLLRNSPGNSEGYDLIDDEADEANGVEAPVEVHRGEDQRDGPELRHALRIRRQPEETSF